MGGFVMNGMYWLILFVILIVIEIATLGLTTIWFAGGCLVAFILSLFHVSLPIQILVFLAVSVVLFIWTRPVAVRYFNKERTKTNVESIVGKTALVVKTIDNVHFVGTVELDGMEWTARAAKEEEIFQKDEVVRIIDVQGVKVIVEKVKNQEEED